MPFPCPADANTRLVGCNLQIANLLAPRHDPDLLGEAAGSSQSVCNPVLSATALPFVPRSHCTRGETGKGELLLTWVIRVSHAEAKPEPMEIPVTLITWRRDRGTWPTALPHSQLGGETALLQVFGKFSSPSLFLRITWSR